MAKLIDLTGKRFGKLLVLSKAASGRVTWNCLCDCGRTSVARGSNLTQGRTKSCGCGQWKSKDRSLGSLLALCKVGKKSECWEWQMWRNDRGYGTVCIDGKEVRAHRAVYAAAYGPIQDRMIVRHKCDNPSCCNPSHLEIGTMKDNSRDMISRNRGKGQFTKGRNRHV